MAAPQPYYEIVTGGATYLLPVQAVVANVDRGDVEMINDEPDRPVGWLTVAYRRVPVFSLSQRFAAAKRDWTRALVIRVDGGEPIGLAVEAVRPADTGEAVPVAISVPGNRIAGGSLFSQALLDGERVRLIVDSERLSRQLHGLPRI